MNLLLLLLVADLEGVVHNAKSQPVAGASVSLSKQLTARTDAEGKYRFPSLPAGSYTVRAEAAGYAPASSGPFTLAAKESKRVDLTLAAAEFFDEPNFVVAGVTNTMNRGGHGSDTVIRSTEAVTRAAASLGKESTDTASPDSLRAAIARDPGNATLHHALAEADERSRNAMEAAREYQRAAELSPSEKNLFDWGTDLLTHRAADQAAEVFAKGHRLFPASSRMLLGLGAALYARGTYDEAGRRFFEAADVNPRDPAPYVFLGGIDQVEIVQMEGYTARMERFAQMYPDRADANYFLAVALWSNRTGNEASRRVEALLAKALRLDPAFAAAHLQLGIVYAAREDFAEAAAAFHKAIELGSKREEVHYRLAQAYQHTGDSAQAQEELQIYQRLRQASADEEERKRREIQQFVFELRQP